MKEKDNKSDMPFYYGAAVILLIISCISMVTIVRNVSGSTSQPASVSAVQNADDVSKETLAETEATLRISHAGMAGYDDGTENATDEPSDALRSKK
jgi:hypothetical protein